jgi:probable F420-dependent oxidoreductase
MKVGVFGTLTDQGIRADELARALEERGFDSLWIGEHTHVPVSVAENPGGGRPKRDSYNRIPDPFVQLGAAAAVTSKLGLATSICLLAQHDPIVLAKQVATLDYLSRGRVRLGVGYGWSEIEMRHHGVDFKNRRAVFQEKLLAMRALWEQDVAEFQGTYVNFEPSYSWPKPVQTRLPVLIGAQAGPKTIADIVELADGWLPLTTRTGEEKFFPQLHAIKVALAERGRPADSITVTLLEPTLAHSNYTPEEYAALLASLPGRRMVEEHKLSGLVIGVPMIDRDRTLAHLDSAAAYYFG